MDGWLEREVRLESVAGQQSVVQVATQRCPGCQCGQRSQNGGVLLAAAQLPAQAGPGTLLSVRMARSALSGALLLLFLVPLLLLLAAAWAGAHWQWSPVLPVLLLLAGMLMASLVGRNWCARHLRLEVTLLDVEYPQGQR